MHHHTLRDFLRTPLAWLGLIAAVTLIAVGCETRTKQYTFSKSNVSQLQVANDAQRLKGASGVNPYCAGFQPGDNNAEDPLSVGTLVSFGKFRTVHLGDLTKNKEFALMCPNNRIGTVDVLLGLHHGVDSSNSEVLVHALRPRVAIMNNGTRKGGQPVVMRTVHASPGLEDLWQMHFSQLSGQEFTVAGLFIANLLDEPQVAMPVAPITAPQPGPGAPAAPLHNGPAYWLKVSAHADGSFSVTNGRNGFSKTYAAGVRPGAD